MDNIFDRSLDRISRTELELRTKDSIKWFRDNINKQEKGFTFKKLQSESQGKTRTRLVPGKMYTYAYDAKYKDTLPYWDKYPLIILLDISKKHMLGLNLHYISPAARAKVLYQLLKITNNKTFSERTKFKLTYSMVRDISKFKPLRPTIKKYLRKNVRSKFIMIDPDEWEIAAFLPTQKWQGSSARKVYSDSRKMK